MKKNNQESLNLLCDHANINNAIIMCFDNNIYYSCNNHNMEISIECYF